jgi:integrase
MQTDIFLSKSDVTKDGKIKVHSSKDQEVKSLIQSYYEKCSLMKIELNNYSIDDVIKLLKLRHLHDEEIDFIKFSNEWISKTKIKGKNNYKTALNAFVRFLDKDSIDVRKIESSMIRDFKNFLIREKNERDKKLKAMGKRVPSTRSLSLYLMSIKRMFKEVCYVYNDEEHNIKLITNNPFYRFEMPKQEATRKRAIQSIFIKKIFELPYQDVLKGVHHTNRFNLAKDCFIISFCLIGMNSADLYNATEYDGKSITYYRKKTKDRRLDNAKMVIKIPKIIKPLMAKYKDPEMKRVFCFYHDYRDEKAFNKAINKGLKQIGDILKIDDLEYYAARHSWATIALNKIGINKYIVHTALNHIDESMRITDIYIERDFVNENNANAKVIKYVFGK